MRPTAHSTVMIEAANKYLDTVKDTIPEEYHQQITDAYYAGMARGLFDESLLEAQGHYEILHAQMECYRDMMENYKKRAEAIRKEIEIMQTPMKYKGAPDQLPLEELMR